MLKSFNFNNIDDIQFLIIFYNFYYKEICNNWKLRVFFYKKNFLNKSKIYKIVLNFWYLVFFLNINNIKLKN